MSKDRLREMISLQPGDTWDKQVRAFAIANGRSRTSIYKWLSNGPPTLIIEVIEYRIKKGGSAESQI